MLRKYLGFFLLCLFMSLGKGLFSLLACIFSDVDSNYTMAYSQQLEYLFPGLA